MHRRPPQSGTAQLRSIGYAKISRMTPLQSSSAPQLAKPAMYPLRPVEVQPLINPWVPSMGIHQESLPKGLGHVLRKSPCGPFSRTLTWLHRPPAPSPCAIPPPVPEPPPQLGIGPEALPERKKPNHEGCAKRLYY
jgi:hypothetical protein